VRQPDFRGLKVVKPLLAAFFFLSALASAETPDAARLEISDKGGWHFMIFPDGSVFGQYGSTTGDSIQLPPRTVNFQETVELVQAALADDRSGEVHAAIRHEGEVVITLKALKDDAFLHELFQHNRHNWKDWQGNEPSDRLRMLMNKIHYYQPAGLILQ
jgi:hypothetical protein